MVTIDKTKLPKAITDKYLVENETFKREIKDNPKDRIEVEIGDSKSPDFKPQFKFMRWDNEVNFSLRAEEDPQAKVKTQGEKIIYTTKDYDVVMYDKPEVSEDGGFEFEWILPKKPSSNVLQATIQTQELNFFYQPALTPEEIAEGAQQPENVVGSYAAYHKTKGGVNRAGEMEYKSGKAFHIYRPHCVDANGNSIYADLNIDEVAGTLTITVDQTWLNNAVYPVIVDPTFGYAAIGATEFEITADNLYASNVSNIINVGGIVESISFYGKVEGTSQNSVAAIYDSSGNLQSPQSSALAINSTTAQWWTNSFSGPTLAAETWLPAVFLDYTDATHNIHIYRDAATSGDTKFQTTAYPTWTDPATFSNSSNRYSIYTTITSSPAVMGKITPGVAGEALSATNNILGFLATAPNNGTLASMSVYIVTDNTTTLKMALYDSGFDTLIASTEEINPTTGWNTATFSSPPSVTASTSYRLAVWASTGAGNTVISNVFKGGDVIYTNDYNYDTLSGVFPSNPTDEFTNTYDGSIYATYAPTAALTGTITASVNESDIVTGGKTLIITLVGETWIAAGAGSFDLQRDEIIAGVDSAQSEATGWDLVPKATQSITGVVRTSDTVVTITWDAFATYNITAQETITVTVPATAVTGGVALVATPTFTIDTVGGAAVTRVNAILTTNPFFWGY